MSKRSPEAGSQTLPKEVQEVFLYVIENAQDPSQLIFAALVACGETKVSPCSALTDPTIKDALESWLDQRRDILDEQTYNMLSGLAGFTSDSDADLT